ncbi:TspO/MBR family protein [Acidisphaera rubrifaciens]|uniref:Transcriptional negative regulator of photosynthesis CrtK/TspO/MBR n=1 Tax=Acidisphaera rubrifaciens HS-AP3 TaxID=1231350 RepID=A0A0D6P608_9PROT|nr:TspO/MBR family protein [Acidisphaera rubrifaciens]GAN76628.1 transcriptional negative regulator of photosynthesis CrtK/TspO/MBR [Acidisphaera rubrifaciens HS-AP3]
MLVALSAGAVTATSVHTWYLSLRRPPGTPPNWVFGPVWTTLYLMMAGAAWLVWRRTGGGRALRLWGWQLLANALWTPAFFGLRLPGLALLVMGVLVVLLGRTVRIFGRIVPLAALLLLPYCVWVLYATYLTAGFWWLNGD